MLGAAALAFDIAYGFGMGFLKPERADLIWPYRVPVQARVGEPMTRYVVAIVVGGLFLLANLIQAEVDPESRMSLLGLIIGVVAVAWGVVGVVRRHNQRRR